MSKKCSGCGVLLQSKDEGKIGYTPSIDNDLCARCFKIKHYNEKVVVSEMFDNEELLEKINDMNKAVIFIVDFLNIYDEVIELYKRIKHKKILVITKSDLIPKNIIREKMVANIRTVYGINEEIILVNSVFNDNLSFLKKFIEKEKEVIMMGFTNAGKSSLINALTSASLTVSKHSNTTLDMMRIKVDDVVIYDTPGFLGANYVDGVVANKRIKAKTFQLRSKYCLLFKEFVLGTSVDNYLTFYMPNDIVLEKRNKVSELNNEIKVLDNSDIVIKGLGFINVKKGCKVYLNCDSSLVEVRKTIIGGSYED